MFGGDGSTFVDLHAASATASFDPAGGFTVPAEFLFHGEYKRAGNDLKIIGEHGTAFVVHDYFKTGHPYFICARWRRAERRHRRRAGWPAGARPIRSSNA